MNNKNKQKKNFANFSPFDPVFTLVVFMKTAIKTRQYKQQKSASPNSAKKNFLL
jgi:hypothetical protein